MSGISAIESDRRRWRFLVHGTIAGLLDAKKPFCEGGMNNRRADAEGKREKGSGESWE
jgi:hypothetical protein